MTISRTAAAIAAASLLAAAALGAELAAPVQAATPGPTPTPTISYPTTTAPGTVTKATILTGDRVGFSAGGFKPGSAITISVTMPGGGRGQAAVLADSVWGTVTASGSGTFGIVIQLTVLGVTTLTATGINPDGSPRNCVALVTVLPRSRASGSASPSPSSSTNPSTSPSTSSSPGSSGSSSPGTSPTAIATGTGTGSAGGGGGSGGSGNLPKTGADGIGPELWLGGGLLAVGGAALLVSMSRRRTREPR